MSFKWPTFRIFVVTKVIPLGNFNLAFTIFHTLCAESAIQLWSKHKPFSTMLSVNINKRKSFSCYKSFKRRKLVMISVTRNRNDSINRKNEIFLHQTLINFIKKWVVWWHWIAAFFVSFVRTLSHQLITLRNFPFINGKVKELAHLFSEHDVITFNLF